MIAAGMNARAGDFQIPPEEARRREMEGAPIPHLPTHDDLKRAQVIAIWRAMEAVRECL